MEAGVRPRPLLALVLLAIAAAACAASTTPAAAAETVIQSDAHLLYRSDEEVRASFAQVRALGIERVRLTASWSLIAPSPDSPTKPAFDAADPSAYPQVGWRYLDRALRLAAQEGLKAMVDIAFYAPRWATRDQPSTPNRLRTEIEPGEYALFAQAVARRYSGSYVPPREPENSPPPPAAPDQSLLAGLLGRLAPPPPPLPPPPQQAAQPLPAVPIFTIWNEPNLKDFVLPQWEPRNGRWWPRSSDIYRAMVYAAYPAIKAAAPGAKVLVGATNSIAASRPGVGSTPPLRFLRALACVDERLRPIRTAGCAAFRQIPGDGWSHHPYSIRTLPSQDARDPNNLPVAGTPRLVATLRALVRAGRLAPANADVYITEYGYETNPPDPRANFSLQRHGALLAEGEYIATRSPAVKMWAQFMLRDLEGDALGGDWQSGLFFADGRPKPAAATFRTPAFATCVRRGSRQWVLTWGHLRGADGRQRAALQASRARSAAWRSQATVASISPHRAGRTAAAVALSPGGAFARYAPWRPGLRYRLEWTGADGATLTSPEITPTGCKPPRPLARARHRRKPRAT
jgi:hypothetical protein